MNLCCSEVVENGIAACYIEVAVCSRHMQVVLRPVRPSQVASLSPAVDLVCSASGGQGELSGGYTRDCRVF